MQKPHKMDMADILSMVESDFPPMPVFKTILDVT